MPNFQDVMIFALFFLLKHPCQPVSTKETLSWCQQLVRRLRLFRWSSSVTSRKWLTVAIFRKWQSWTIKNYHALSHWSCCSNGNWEAGGAWSHPGHTVLVSSSQPLDTLQTHFKVKTFICHNCHLLPSSGPCLLFTIPSSGQHWSLAWSWQKCWHPTIWTWLAT